MLASLLVESVFAFDLSNIDEAFMVEELGSGGAWEGGNLRHTLEGPGIVLKNRAGEPWPRPSAGPRLGEPMGNLGLDLVEVQACPFLGRKVHPGPEPEILILSTTFFLSSFLRILEQ
jgi:hypothetical protein